MNVSSPSTPLEFWVSLGRDEDLALDEVVYCQRPVGGHGMVSFYGVVEEVQMVLIDSLVDYQAKVKITRIAPEVFVPPTLRAAVNRAGPEQLAQALHFDGMKQKLPLGLLASGHTAYANLDFLNGKKGAHVNIAGISGVATKTSYALFLLYGIFHSPAGDDYYDDRRLSRWPEAGSGESPDPGPSTSFALQCRGTIDPSLAGLLAVGSHPAGR